MMKGMKILMVGVLAIAMVACSASSVVSIIQVVLTAVAALQSALPLAGVSPALAKEIGEYATAAAAGAGKCASQLAMGGDTTVLVAECGQDLAGAVKPTLPPGTPQNVASLVELIYSELKAVYVAIEAGQTGGKTSVSPKTGMVFAKAPTVWKPSAREASQLRSLAAKAMKLAKS